MRSESAEEADLGQGPAGELPTPPEHRQGWPWRAPSASSSLQRSSDAHGRWPKVTIVVPSYDQAPFLEQTLRSILLQDYPDIEVWVIDGGSDDGSLEILRRYEAWLAGWVSEEDRGQAHAVNKGWQRASGDLVGWLNSDDLLMPGALAQTAGTLRARPGIDLVYGDNLIIDRTGDPLPPPYDRQEGRPFSEQEFLFRWRQPVRQPGFLMRRSVLDRVGMLDEAFQFAMDFEFFVRVARAGCEAVHLPSVVAAFRRHGRSKTETVELSKLDELLEIHRRAFTGAQAPGAEDAVARRAQGSLANLYLEMARVAFGIPDVSATRHFVDSHLSVVAGSAHLEPHPEAARLRRWSALGNLGVRAARRAYRLLRGLGARARPGAAGGGDYGPARRST
jgi:glycosyltransferase involved in cell wall biosynthesis